MPSFNSTARREELRLVRNHAAVVLSDGLSNYVMRHMLCISPLFAEPIVAFNITQSIAFGCQVGVAKSSGVRPLGPLASSKLKGVTLECTQHESRFATLTISGGTAHLRLRCSGAWSVGR